MRCYDTPTETSIELENVTVLRALLQQHRMIAGFFVFFLSLLSPTHFQIHIGLPKHTLKTLKHTYRSGVKRSMLENDIHIV